MSDTHPAIISTAPRLIDILADRPFDLNNDSAYSRWRACKLENYPSTTDELIVEVSNPRTPTPAERQALIERCRKTNMAIYACPPDKAIDKHVIRRLGQYLGLYRLDTNLYADTNGVTSVRVMPAGSRQREYIPYSNRALNWHTDGYYNRPTQRIRAFIIHCVQDAASGGENAFLDPEIVYLLMRDKNPSLIAALMQGDVMRIPANVEQGTEIRRTETGPVFTLDAVTGKLHMRYSARKHNIEWKDDSLTRAAVGFLESLLTDNGRYVFRHRLDPGQGVVCNNVLHRRCAFTDDTLKGRERLFYRARYYDRIAATWPTPGNADALA